MQCRGAAEARMMTSVSVSLLRGFWPFYVILNFLQAFDISRGQKYKSETTFNSLQIMLVAWLLGVDQTNHWNLFYLIAFKGNTAFLCE